MLLSDATGPAPAQFEHAAGRGAHGEAALVRCNWPLPALDVATGSMPVLTEGCVGKPVLHYAVGLGLGRDERVLARAVGVLLVGAAAYLLRRDHRRFCFHVHVVGRWGALSSIGMLMGL